jgi:hypothetical protein
MPETIVGRFSNWDDARQAMEQLGDLGVPLDSISVVAADRADRAMAREADRARAERRHEEEEGALVGAAAGGALGAAGGWALGLGILTVPGLGGILAAGPILGALTGLAAGAGAGGLVGVLIGHGVAEEEAPAYAAAIREGDVLVAVSAPGREADALNVLETSGAADLARYGSPAPPELTDPPITPIS